MAVTTAASFAPGLSFPPHTLEGNTDAHSSSPSWPVLSAQTQHNAIARKSSRAAALSISNIGKPKRTSMAAPQSHQSRRASLSPVPTDQSVNTMITSASGSCATAANLSQPRKRRESNTGESKPKRSFFGRKEKPLSSTYATLAAASLSTPELHLASDPLRDVDDAAHRDLISSAGTRRLGEAKAQLLPRQSVGQLTDLRPSVTVAKFPMSGTSPFFSLDAAVDSVQDQVTDVDPESQLKRGHRSRRTSNATVVVHGIDDTEPATPLSPTQELSRTSQSSKRSSSSKWFRRRKESAATVEPMPEAVIGQALTKDESFGDISTLALPPSVQAPLMSRSNSDSGSDLSMSELIRASAQDCTFASTSLAGERDREERPLCSQAVRPLERLRSARRYMLTELCQLSLAALAPDRKRIADLESAEEEIANTADETGDAAPEMLGFWTAISDGVLLCVLLNRLRPGAVDTIDRRDIEWAKNDNLTRFLRGIRDYLDVPTTDLFHPLDLTEGTVEGLDRAIGTILSVAEASDRKRLSVGSTSSPLSVNSIARAKSKRRSLLVSPPTSPPLSTIELAGSASSPMTSDTDNTIDLSFGSASKSLQLNSIRRHREAAEQKLLAGAPPLSFLDSAPQSPIRRSKSKELKRDRSSASRGPSISFAGGTLSQQSNEEAVSRPLYRDRKLSESAVSLHHVAEESEDLGHSISDGSARSFERVERLGSEDDGNPLGPSLLGLGRPSTGVARVVMARSSSQRRISAEIANANVRSFRASLDGADLRNVYSSSSNRPSPPRRHSGRFQSNVSVHSPLGNDRPLHLASPRPSFSRNSSARESRESVFPSTPPDSRSPRNDSIDLLSSPLAAYSSVPPLELRGVGTKRSSSRHGRSNSEFPVNLSRRSSAYTSDGNDNIPSTPTFRPAQPILIRPRSRVDSEGGSLYLSSVTGTPSEGRKSHERCSSFSSSVIRDPSEIGAARHKLILTAEDGCDIAFQMGNCIGRGQFGSVYRALNLNSGQMVAVKRIKLESRSEDEVTQLMKEVDLLKSLTHPSVVKYEGFIRGPDVVSIILEYVENGSLLHTLKSFGTFPEKLVASYVVKILEGLAYLHENSVVHCDLKAANILTTKNGNVKLSDFGVSLNLKAMERVHKNDAVGTPNWMAPEVIELKGASTAADIWSLGCTIVELLTGKPPYGDMLAMSAMFRIVEDDQPPIPAQCSTELRAFLTLCFDKDPTKRPSAEDLFEHEWLRVNWVGSRDVRVQDSVPFIRRISTDSKRIDIKTLHAIVNEVAEPVGTPSRPSSARPGMAGMRAFSTPVEAPGWGAKVLLGNDSMPALVASPITDTALLTAAGTPPRPSGTLSHTPSILDGVLAATPFTSSSIKSHCFVKSTFSKAVRCRLCQDSVRRHAVLCEDCGLICHASCARDVSGPCDLRAQLSLFHAKLSRTDTDATGYFGGDAISGVAPAKWSVQAPITNGVLASGFKMAVARARRSSSSRADVSLEEARSSVTAALPSILWPPRRSSLDLVQNEPAPAARQRRISLRFLRKNTSTRAVPGPLNDDIRSCQEDDAIGEKAVGTSVGSASEQSSLASARVSLQGARRDRRLDSPRLTGQSDAVAISPSQIPSQRPTHPKASSANETAVEKMGSSSSSASPSLSPSPARRPPRPLSHDGKTGAAGARPRTVSSNVVGRGKDECSVM